MTKEIKSPRIARRREKTRGAILLESSRLFSSLGIEATRFEDIANAADVARGTLYSFFKNKESLIDELILNIQQKLIAGIESIKTIEPSSRMDALFNIYLDLWESNPDALLILDQTRQKLKLKHKEYASLLKTKMEEIFSSMENHLRSRDSKLSMELFSSTSVRSLKIFSVKKDYRDMFKEHFKALLLSPATL